MSLAGWHVGDHVQCGAKEQPVLVRSCSCTVSHLAPKRQRIGNLKCIYPKDSMSFIKLLCTRRVHLITIWVVTFYTFQARALVLAQLRRRISLQKTLNCCMLPHLLERV